MKEYLINVTSKKENDYYINADSTEEAMALAMDFFINDEDQINTIEIQEVESNEVIEEL